MQNYVVPTKKLVSRPISITIEVGSRGFINTPSFNALYEAFPVKRHQREALEKDVVRKCILESYQIWCKRNCKKPSIAGD